MQTAQLTSNGRITTEFFAVLFLFDVVKNTETGRNIRNLLGSFLYFIFFLGGGGGGGGHFGVKHG